MVISFVLLDYSASQNKNSKAAAMSGYRLFISLFLVVVGSLAAAFVQTDGGQVRVEDLRFAGAEGNVQSALLFIPQGATRAHPAPAV
ncbi:MAG: hypothetical protein KDI19_06950, partial [Pseudomonadales bacterium]|nr:hypothetical protein [Pseudomonadales bacterium]